VTRNLYTRRHGEAFSPFSYCMEHGNQNWSIRLGIPYYWRPVCGEYYENDQKIRDKTGLSGALHMNEGDKRCGY